MRSVTIRAVAAEPLRAGEAVSFIDLIGLRRLTTLGLVHGAEFRFHTDRRGRLWRKEIRRFIVSERTRAKAST